jgi:hypothetical protein
MSSKTPRLCPLIPESSTSTKHALPVSAYCEIYFRLHTHLVSCFLLHAFLLPSCVSYCSANDVWLWQNFMWVVLIEETVQVSFTCSWMLFVMRDVLRLAFIFILFCKNTSHLCNLDFIATSSFLSFILHFFLFYF